MDKTIRQNTKMLYLLQGLLFSYIITAFVLLLLAFFMLKLDLSGMVISGGINFTYVVSAFIGGFFVGKKSEHRKFFWGLVMGSIYFIVLVLVSLLMHGMDPLSVKTMFTVFVMSSLSGMLGGMVS